MRKSRMQPAKEVKKTITTSEAISAFQESQTLLKNLKEGYISVDMILTSLKEVKATFPKVIAGTMLQILGHSFFWKRPVGEAMILYGRNDFLENLKDHGVVELCRFKAPDSWIGVGRFKIAWPRQEKEGSEDSVLITLYLYSADVNDFYRLTASERAKTAFMACLFLDVENGELFFELVEKRYRSLR